MTIHYSLTLRELVPWFFARNRHWRQTHPSIIYLLWGALTLFIAATAYLIWQSHLIARDIGYSAPIYPPPLLGLFMGLLAPVATF